MQILRNVAAKPRLPWKRQCWRTRHDDFKCSQTISRNVAKFGGHSLNGFEVIQLFPGGLQKLTPDLNRVKDQGPVIRRSISANPGLNKKKPFLRYFSLFLKHPINKKWTTNEKWLTLWFSIFQIWIQFRTNTSWVIS